MCTSCKIVFLRILNMFFSFHISLFLHISIFSNQIKYCHIPLTIIVPSGVSLNKFILQLYISSLLSNGNISCLSKDVNGSTKNVIRNCNIKHQSRITCKLRNVSLKKNICVQKLMTILSDSNLVFLQVISHYLCTFDHNM